MIEMRQDPTTRIWILNGRVGAAPARSEPVVICPFCPGREADTPPAVSLINGPGGGWKVRSVPDRAPVFQVEGDLDRQAEGLYDRMRNVGAHEVVVETPLHDTTLARLPAADILLVLQMFRQRIRDLKRDARFRYVQVFKNQGTGAGSRLAHAHSHLVATPVIPRRLEAELRWSKAHYDRKERCLYCDMLHQEREQGGRVVEDDGAFVAFCPYASRFPYEVWLVPVAHRHQLEDQDDPTLARLADALKRVLLRIEATCPDYHLTVHTAPNEESPPVWGRPWETLRADFHWHIEVLPRPAETARLHREEEFYVNSIPPEEAARHLRSARPV
jgi:UDPglucose--hexose-1-phosphate uridylyltransferase